MTTISRTKLPTSVGQILRKPATTAAGAGRPKPAAVDQVVAGNEELTDAKRRTNIRRREPDIAHSTAADTTAAPDKKPEKTNPEAGQKKTTATESTGAKKKISVKVSKNVPDDAPIPKITDVKWSFIHKEGDYIGLYAVESQVVVEDAKGKKHSTEIDQDNLAFDFTDAEIENEVIIGGWKYTYQVKFDDDYTAESIVLLDAKKV